MRKRNILLPPLKKDFFFRPRVNELIEAAAEHSMATVVAGAGFGKTQAVSAFAHRIETESHSRVIWLSIRQRDNSPQAFWDNCVKTMQIAFADLNLIPKEPRMPDSIDEMQLIANEFIRKFPPEKKLIVIIDNYERLVNKQVHKLILSLISLFTIINACWIIISQQKTDLEIAGIGAKRGLLEIKQEQLQFTEEEAWNYFAATGIKVGVNSSVVSQVMHETEGWPLAVNIARQLHEQNNYSYNTGKPFDNIHDLFCSMYFQNYPQAVRRLLIQLSMLDVFTMDIAEKLLTQYCASDTRHLQKARSIIENHAFIRLNHTSGMYRMHFTYRRFLTNMQYEMTPRETTQFYRVAAEVFLDNDQILEALECYGKISEHKKSLLCINRLALHKLDQESCSNLLRLLEALPQGFADQEPSVDLFRSYIYLFYLEIEQATGLLNGLKKRLEAKKDAQSKTVLGEAYLLLATASIMQNTDRFFIYYKEAYNVFPQDATPREDVFFLFKIVHMLFLQKNEENELERLQELRRKSIKYIERFEKGSGRAFYNLFTLEMAHQRFDLSLAVQLAYQAIYEAKADNLHYAVVGAYWRLAQVLIHQGNLAEAIKIKSLVLDLTQSQDDPIYLYYGDRADLYFRIYLRDIATVPSWFANSRGIEETRLPIYMDTEGVLYIHYLYTTGDHVKGLHYNRLFKKRFDVKGNWGNTLNGTILRAVSYMQLGDKRRALAELWNAYQMSYKNGIITPFIGLGKDMRTLTRLAQGQKSHAFDEQWLKSIYQKASTFAKKYSVMCKEYNAHNERNASSRLTKREMEVLTSLSQGLTREEIASLSGVSSGTIKTIIKQIYYKLGAVNNADAVRIAFELGLFKQADSGG